MQLTYPLLLHLKSNLLGSITPPFGLTSVQRRTKQRTHSSNLLRPTVRALIRPYMEESLFARSHHLGSLSIPRAKEKQRIKRLRKRHSLSYTHFASACFQCFCCQLLWSDARVLQVQSFRFKFAAILLQMCLVGWSCTYLPIWTLQHYLLTSTI